MNIFDQLRSVLRNVSDEDFRDSINGFAQENSSLNLSALPKPVDLITRGGFLGHLHQIGLLGVYNDYLVQKPYYANASRAVSTGGRGNETIPFENRESELQILSLGGSKSTHYVVSAPAGYGKSRLLEQVKDHYGKIGWDCGLARVSPDQTIRDLVYDLAEHLGITIDGQDNKLDWGLRLCAAWRGYHVSGSGFPKGLVLLIDLDKRSVKQLFCEIVEQFVGEFVEGLNSLDVYETEQLQFRVIIFGRNLSSFMPKDDLAAYGFTGLSLSPFDYDIVLRATRKYLPHETLVNVRQLAAHVLALSAGHPDCIAHILFKFKEQQIPWPRFWKLYSSDISADVARITDEVSEEFFEELDNSLELPLTFLSIFRYVDIEILREVVKMPGVKLRDEFDLEDKLISSSMYTKRGGLLRDDILRRLILSYDRARARASSMDMYDKALKLCGQRIETSERPELWVIEYLYQLIQLACLSNAVNTAEERKILKERILQSVLPTLLESACSEHRDLQAKRQVLREIIHQIDDGEQEQEDFSFCLNYYLRDDQFSPSVLGDLRSKVENFLKQVEEEGSK